MLAGFVLFIISVLTLGLLHPLLLMVYALIPFCYHTLLLGGPSHATLGMRLMGIEMKSLTIGSPDYVQAAVQTVLFYLSISIFSPILIWALFDPRRRMLHDNRDLNLIVEHLASTPLPDQDQLLIHRLKKRKLLLKDKIFQLERLLVPDIPA